MASKEGPTVTVNGCTITGARQPSTAEYPRAVDIFYGIPFATAERFRAAVAACPGPEGDGRMDASEPGSVQPMAFPPHPTAESPLRLNIFRPASSSSADEMDVDTKEEGEGQGGARAKYPVVVYVHGGGFNFGHALERDLASFVSWAERDILAVSISYRIGALGFPAGWDEDDEEDDDEDHGSDGNDDDEEDDDEEEEEEEEGDEDRVREMNLGLKDQRLAVEWVKEWVGAFGGDAENLTMMGVSAGAHSIGHHILSPSPLPFHKAILESGAPTARSVLSPHHPRPVSQWQTLKLYAGGPLGALPADALVEASTAVFANSMSAVTWPFQPVVDGPGGVIPDLPLRLWDDFLSDDSGRAKTLSVITGFCSHEGTMFAPQSASTSAEFRSFFSTLIPSLSPSDLDSLDLLYPDPLIHPDSPYRQPPGIGGPNMRSYGAQFRRIHEAYAHYAYICPVLHTAHALARAGARVYLYEFAALAAPFRASSHGDQTPLVSHQMSDLQSAPGLVAVAQEMHSRWTCFAASSPPPGGGPGAPDAHELAWPLFQSPFALDGSQLDPAPGVAELLVFGDGNDEAAGGSNAGTPVKTRTLTEAELRQCRFWWERMELSQGLGKPGIVQPFKSKS